MGLRSTIQKTTGVTPYETIFGNKMRTPLSWNYDSSQPTIARRNQNENDKVPLNEFILDLQFRLSKIHQTIRERMTTKTERGFLRKRKVKQNCQLEIMLWRKYFLNRKELMYQDMLDLM